jgi:predicted dehydrogenase
VIGYGYWGSKHVRVLSSMPDVVVSAVDHDDARLAQVRRDFPSVPVDSNVREAVRSVDAVIVATPPRTHAAVAKAVLEAGRHVLVEKPLGVSTAECEELIDAADAAGAVLMVGHTFQYNAAVWKLRELIQDGALGATRYVDAARLNLGLYQQDVNVIWDLAPHDVSIVNFLLGSAPVAVSAWGHNHATPHLEDVAYLQLRYEKPDMSAYIHVSWLDPCKVRRVTVVGADKMAVYNDMSPNERIRVYDIGVAPSSVGADVHNVPMSYRYGDIVSPYIEFDEPLAVQNNHFLECVRDGAHPRTDGGNGLEVVRVLEAASAALTLGGEIALDGFHSDLDRGRRAEVGGDGSAATALAAGAAP